MNKNHFSTPEFAISDTGIHLLRGGYNHTTIDFQSVRSMEIKRGKEFRNWVILLIFSFVLIGIGMLYSNGLYQAILDVNKPKIDVAEFAVPIFTLLMGGFGLFFSLRKATILVVADTNGRTLKFSLREIENAGKLDSLKEFLRAHLEQQFQDSHS